MTELLAPDGGPHIGTLCLIDHKPREFGSEQVKLLGHMARMTEVALQLRNLATVDGLTGASTRRAFREDFGRLLLLGSRHKFDVSLVVFDIDHFKKVNDTYGHSAGDQVLSRAVVACREKLRATDAIGRLGGEEFAVALPHTDRAQATIVAEQLRQAIEAMICPVGDTVIRVTASLGVSAAMGPEDNVDCLLKRADEALYRAKTAGRNRTLVAADQIAQDAGRRVLKAGRISFHGARSAIECTVRHQGEASAHLQVESTALVPDAFKLDIDVDGLSRLCRVIERKGAFLIVSMDGP